MATPPPPRTPRLAPERRRAQLLDSALDVLVEGGFDAVNVEAVARRAGVTRPVIYDTFGDLESLMLALIDRADATASRAMLQIVGGTPPEDMSPDSFVVDSVLAFLRAVQADPKTWRLVLMPPRGDSPELSRRIRRARRQIADQVKTLLDWGVAARGGPLGLDHELMGRLVVAIGEDAARLMLAHPRRFSPERLAEATRDLVALVPPSPVAARRAWAIPEVRATPPATPAAPATTDPAARPRRVPQAERREQLLDVCLSLLAEEGFGALSMEAIARRAGVNRVVIYRSFANLAGLLAALMQREDRRVRGTLRHLIPSDALERPLSEILFGSLASLIEAVVRQPQTWRVALLRPESAPRALQKIVNLRRAALARRLEPILSRVIYDLRPEAPDYEVEAIARMLLTIGEEQGRLVLDDPDYPPERVLRASADLLAAMDLP